MANAEHVRSFRGAIPGSHIDLYFAHTGQETWPGYDCPLGHAGYWLGTHEFHVFLGESQHTSEEAEWYIP